jgi:hypothetical protein
MTAARLPIIVVLVSPVAPATAAASFCAASVSGARIPVLALCCRHSRDIVSPRVARSTGVARPFTGFPICRCDRLAATAAFKSP